MNLKIIVCTHRKNAIAACDPYLPVHAGKTFSQTDSGIQGDDEGDNISEKNKRYCELTSLYWAWKNLKNVDYIGLCHYRRYFDFHNKINRFKDLETVSPDCFKTLNLTVPDTDRLFGKAGIILAKPKIHPYSVGTFYCCCHFSKDLKIIESVIKELYPDYLESFMKIIYKNNKSSYYNMFIMKWSDFENYCTWLFSILEKAERMIDTAAYDSLQTRVLAYIAERLLNVYVEKEKMKIKYLPVFLITDARRTSAASAFFRPVKYNLSFFFQRI
jgi:hypothetical protein